MTTFSYEHWVRDNSHCRSRTHDGNIYIQRKSSCITNILFLDISTILHIARKRARSKAFSVKKNNDWNYQPSTNENWSSDTCDWLLIMIHLAFCALKRSYRSSCKDPQLSHNKEESESYNFILKTRFLQRGLKSSVHIFPSQLVSSVSAANICSGWPHSIKCATRRDVPQQQTPKKKQNGKLDKSLQILHLNILHSKLSEFYKGQRFFVDAQLDDPEYSVIEGGIK